MPTAAEGARTLLDGDSRPVASFPSPFELFAYLRDHARQAGPTERENWRFMAYSHRMLARLLKELGDESFVGMAREACRQEKNLLLFCTGHADNPALFLESPDLDVERLQDHWIEAYCRHRGFRVVRG